MEALQSTEGGDIPTDIYGESLSGKKFETLTVRLKKKKEEQQTPGQMTLFDVFSGQNAGEQQSAGVAEPAVDSTPTVQPQVTGGQAQQTETTEQVQTQSSADTETPAQPAPVTSQPSVTATQSENNAAGSQQAVQTETSEEEDLFDREEVMKFINDAGLLSYNVRALRINDYLKSLYRMAHLLTMSNLHREASRQMEKMTTLFSRSSSSTWRPRFLMPLEKPWTTIRCMICSRRQILI